MYFQYLGYVLSLAVLFVLPSNWYRLAYLHGISTLLLIFSHTSLNYFIILAMIHSAIHHLWPFMTHKGYNQDASPFYDVLCHTVMIYAAHNLVAEHLGSWVWLSYFFILGSIGNTINSVYLTPKINTAGDTAFGFTSVFQAVSTGFWISTMLWYGSWADPSFVTHWLAIIGIMVANWGLYKLSHKAVGYSMKYNYVEAVFIVCTWVGAVSQLLA